MEQEISNALKVLREGGTILYPTDTIWGIGCDATNEKAVEKVLTIKKRETAAPTLNGENPQSSFRDLGQAGSKSLIALVSDDGMLNRFVKDIPELAWDLMEASGAEDAKPITILYDAGRGLAKNVPAEDGSIGIRMVKNGFCNNMIYKFGKPVVSTSANISGMPAPQNFSEIADEIIKSVDYVVNWRQDETGSARPSSIIKLKDNGEFVILRK